MTPNKNSLIGYINGILWPHLLHFPRLIIYPITGIKYNLSISDLQLSQEDWGYIMLIFLGIL